MYKKLLIIILFFIITASNSFAADKDALIKAYIENAFSKIRENSPIIASPRPIVFEVKIKYFR